MRRTREHDEQFFQSHFSEGEGAKLLAFSMVTCICCSFYHVQVFFLIVSKVVFKSKAASFPDVFNVYIVTCKLRYNWFAAGIIFWDHSSRYSLYHQFNDEESYLIELTSFFTPSPRKLYNTRRFCLCFGSHCMVDQRILRQTRSNSFTIVHFLTCT